MTPGALVLWLGVALGALVVGWAVAGRRMMEGPDHGRVSEATVRRYLRMEQHKEWWR